MKGVRMHVYTVIFLIVVYSYCLYKCILFQGCTKFMKGVRMHVYTVIVCIELVNKYYEVAVTSTYVINTVVSGKNKFF